MFSFNGLYSLSYYYGLKFLYEGKISLRNMFIAIFSVFYSSLHFGSLMQYLPDLGKSNNCAKNLLFMLDQKKEIKNEVKFFTLIIHYFLLINV